MPKENVEEEINLVEKGVELETEFALLLYQITLIIGTYRNN